MKPPRPGPGFVVANTLLLWAATVLGVVALWPIYRSTQLLFAMGVAILLGSVIAMLGAVFRWPAPIVLLATVVVFLGTGVPLAVPGQTTLGILPTTEGLTDLISGVALGWKQLLTITLPVGEYESLLVPFFALVLVLTVVGLSMALRARRGEIAVLGPVILLVAAIAFGPTSATAPIALGLGLLLVSLVWIIWRRWYRRRTAIRLLTGETRGETSGQRELRADTRFVGLRTVLSAGLILVLASGTAVAAAAVVPPAGTRTVLRSSVEQPFQPQDYPSPLAGFRNYWQKSDVDSVMLTVRGLPAGSRIRIATLDSYDGVVYSVGSADVDAASGSFTRVPYEFDQSAVRGKPVSLSITVQDYTGVWLPTVGDFERITFDGGNADSLRNGFFYNNTTGTAADLSGLKTGESYSLDAVIPSQPKASDLARVTAGSASVPPLTTIPSELTSVLNDWVSGANTPGEKLVAMLAALKKNGYVSHGIGTDEAPSRSGHAVDRIDELLTDQQMIGDGEQYSVTAALMARELGFPARVVLGFVPKTTAAGTSEVRGKDISAWIEVDTAQYGWVTVDPNPPVRPIPVIKPKDPNLVSRPQTIVPPVVTQAAPPNPQTVPDSQQHDSAPINQFVAVLVTVLTITGWTLLAILILLSPFLFIVATKARKRRRRRAAATPAEQIRGGWREFQDRVLDHGFALPPAATRSEVATTVGGAGPVVLATVTDRATFAPDAPEAEEADRVWRSVGELTASLGAGKSRWERIKARVSLRSFGGGRLNTLLKR